MVMTLTQARTRVRTLVDDPSPGVRWTDQEIDDALGTGGAEGYSIALNAGTSLFAREDTVSTLSDGSYALAATVAPRAKIIAVSIVLGGYRQNVPPLRPGDVTQLYSRVESLVVMHCPPFVFPTNPASQFVWGASSADIPELDKLACLIAASELKITDAEVLGGLETRKEELKLAVQRVVNAPSWFVLPLTPQRQVDLRWYKPAADTLRLAYA